MGAELVGVIMPAAWTAAALSFQALLTATGGGGSGPQTRTFGEVFDHNGAAITIASASSAAGQYVAIPASVAAAIRAAGALKVRSGLSGAPVNQGADRVVTLVVLLADEE